MAWVLLLAVGAGMLTTLAGMGGGLIMVLGLSAVGPVSDALVISTPALLLGNVHRVVLYRRDLHREDATAYVVFGALGALLGAAIALQLPEALLRAGLALVGVAAIARQQGNAPPLTDSAVRPGAFATGVVSATLGGGGLIAGPMLLARGHTGTAYVGTAAAGATAIHCARMIGYGAGGWWTPRLAALGALATVALLVGNLLAHRLRPHLGRGHTRRLELGTVIGVAGFVFLGAARAMLDLG